MDSEPGSAVRAGSPPDQISDRSEETINTERIRGRYRPSPREMKQIDIMLGVALLDDQVARQLLFQRSNSFLRTFGLAEPLRHWLMSIEATSLEDFVQAVLAGCDTPVHKDYARPEGPTH